MALGTSAHNCIRGIPRAHLCIGNEYLSIGSPYRRRNLHGSELQFRREVRLTPSHRTFAILSRSYTSTRWNAIRAGRYTSLGCDQNSAGGLQTQPESQRRIDGFNALQFRHHTTAADPAQSTQSETDEPPPSTLGDDTENARTRRAETRERKLALFNRWRQKGHFTVNLQSLNEAADGVSLKLTFSMPSRKKKMEVVVTSKKQIVRFALLCCDARLIACEKRFKRYEAQLLLISKLEKAGIWDHLWQIDPLESEQVPCSASRGLSKEDCDIRDLNNLVTKREVLLSTQVLSLPQNEFVCDARLSVPNRSMSLQATAAASTKVCASLS